MKKIKKILGKFKAPSIYTQMRLYYASNYEKIAIDDEMIVYETRDGKTIVDSPYAMFLELVKNEDYGVKKHIWVIDESIVDIKKSIPKEYINKVKFINRNSLDYPKALLEAKYIVSNSTVDSFFSKKEEQIYINTWHGTPLKHMGFDIPGKVHQSQNVLRNFLMTDYLMSPNSHTSRIFTNSYKLKGIYPGEILESGYPRIDLTINSLPDDVYKKLETFGTKLNSSKQTILYCPTWKGSNVGNPTDSIEQIVTESLRLKEEFGLKYNVILKVHPFIYSKISEEERIKDMLVSDLMDANELLSLIDILVTDYSSIFFDFLVTGKPIVFYSWDNDLYEQERGMYISDNELPGPVTETIEELIGVINDIDEYKNKYETRYSELSKKIVNYDDGESTKRYLDYIFKKEESVDLKILGVDSDKTKLLIYPGGMRNNGITSSLLNLVNNIDYEAYDVTIITNSTGNKEINDNLRELNPNARVMFRFGQTILDKDERQIDKYFMKNGVSKNNRYKYPASGYKREMNRLTANLKYDVAIDFSGYSYFWGRHILGANAKKYVAFMHNDLMADSMREINGKMPMYQDLHGLFSIYYKFDKLLSVSPMTRDVNYKKLSDYVTPEQMSFVYNSINIENILSSVKEISNTEDKLIITNKSLGVAKNLETYKFKNIKSINNNFEELHLNLDDNIYEHAVYNDIDKSYSKITVNGEYIGWVDSDILEPKKNVVYEIKDVEGIGTVAAKYHYPIWKNLRENTEQDEVVAYAKYFKHRYLEFRKEAITSNGQYYLVYYNNKKVGWVSTSILRRLHLYNKNYIKKMYYQNQMKNQEQKNPLVYSKSVQEVELYAKLKKDNLITLWNNPKGVLGTEEIPFTKEYLEQTYEITRKIEMPDTSYYSLRTNTGVFVGWTAEENISEISFEEFLGESNVDEDEFSILPKIDLANQKVIGLSPDCYSFVNMGRLSPEKNQDRLIEAFALFNKEVPNSRLYILGKGPLEKDLIQKIIDTDMSGKVFLLGHIKQPFNFIKEANTFILPSFYEGQPMVLLESMVLGMDILASNIPANINVVGANEDYGLLTSGTEINDIYEGMLRIYNHKAPFKTFDYIEYNKEAMESFYKEVLP